ncbi:hypothetical protein NQZ68_038943 [Dissostichus eleginoides]|nr:hypothetical protein NQZ68_038943 [Dissostichus eleginoides]
MDNDRGRYQVVENTSALRISSMSTTVLNMYTCLVMNQQQCVSSHPAQVVLNTEWMYRSVEETAVLQCPVTDLSDEEPPHWEDRFYTIDQGKHIHSLGEVDKNYSLVFTSVTLNHSGVYLCKTSIPVKVYILVVCPKSPPPAVELFSEGEEVTLRCKAGNKGQSYHWFFKSTRTGGRTFSQYHMTRTIGDRYPDGRLVIPNVSLQDTGEYWCPVLDRNHQCLISTKTVLKHRDPFGVHSTFYAARCSALSVLLLMLCVVVVTVTLRTRTRDT